MSRIGRYQLCVSGSARGSAVEKNASVAYEIGKAIARANATLLTGATVGIPDHAAKGCHAAGGQSIGISPATSRLEHIKKYRLPIKAYDYILYTGMNYIGRDALLISSSDAVIYIGGRIGTLHEFSIGLELEKVLGVVDDSGGTSEWFDEILVAAGLKNYDAHNVIFDSNPERLVKRVLKRLKEIEVEEGREPGELSLKQ